MNNKIIVVDLRTSGFFGPACKFVELLTDYQNKGYKINLIAKDWSVFRQKGVTFNKDKKQFEKGDFKLTWDPSTHPKDYFENLILPTFEKVNYIKEYKDNKLRQFINTYFNPYYINHIIYISMHMEKIELKRYHNQIIDELLTGRSLRQKAKWLFSYVGKVIQLRFIGYFKVHSKSKGFRYKINDSLNNEDLRHFINNAKKDSCKYILLSVLWDEGKKFEKQDDRLKGGPTIFPDIHDKNFDELKEYVKELDKYALKTGKIRFLLASKKAVDWISFLQSDYLDLRYFEEYGFTLSQSLYAAQEIASATINWPSTYSIWITNCADITHLTWYNNKDTAAWARNDLHLKPPSELIKILCE